MRARRLAATGALVAVALFPAQASAQGGGVKVPGSFVTETQLSEDGSRCNAYLTYVWGHIPGAVSYRVEATDTITGSYDDTVEPGFDAGLADGLPPVGKNRQRTRMNAAFGPAPCPGDLNGGRWTVRVTANFCEAGAARRQGDEECKSRLVGTASRSDGSPAAGVPIRLDGPTGKTTRTNSGGGYGAEVKPGNYTVNAPTGFCAVGVSGCKSSKRESVRPGEAASVDFVAKDSYFVEGTIEDEFGRGLDGVDVHLRGPETETGRTDESGNYKVEVGEPGTYELFATGQSRGPHELYYIRLADGQSSGGQAADVPFGGSADSSYEIDWVLDTRLQFSLETRQVLANGVGSAPLNLRALTQHGDPAPNVEMSIDVAQNSGGHPLSVICNANAALASRPLWPTLDSSGNYQLLGLPFGPETTTDDTGTIPLEVFPGTEGGNLRFSGNRRGDVASVFSTDIAFAPSSGGLDEERVKQGLSEAHKNWSFADRQVLIDYVASARGIPGDPLSGADVVPVRAGAKSGLAFFPLGTPLGNPASGEVAPVQGAWVFDDDLLQTGRGPADLPSLAEWSGGEPILSIRDDNRTFLGYPLHTSIDGSVGECLAGAAGATMTFAAHSPAHISLTDGQGNRVGFDAQGKELTGAPGAMRRIEGDDYVIVPAGNYELTVAGTGNGPVTLEARSGAATRTAAFTARKGEKATLKVSGGSVLPKQFEFGGERVRSVAGIPLEVKGLPRKLRAGKRTKLNLSVRDALGEKIASPALVVSGAAEATAFGDAGGRIRTSVVPEKAGRVAFEVSAAGRLAAKRSVKATKP